MINNTPTPLPHLLSGRKQICRRSPPSPPPPAERLFRADATSRAFATPNQILCMALPLHVMKLKVQGQITTRFTTPKSPQISRGGKFGGAGADPGFSFGGGGGGRKRLCHERRHITSAKIEVPLGKRALSDIGGGSTNI